MNNEKKESILLCYWHMTIEWEKTSGILVWNDQNGTIKKKMPKKKELPLYFNSLITRAQGNCNDECSVSYKSAEIILNGTIILCNLSFQLWS